MILSGLFGNETASKVLLYLENYKKGYPRAIAEAFSISLSQVQRQLERLELEGVLVSHLVGRVRTYEMNPRCFYKTELEQILKKALARLPADVQEKYFRARARPRRAEKSFP